MSTQAPEAPGAQSGTEGTPPAGDASITPEPTANGAGSHEPAAAGSASEPAATPAADDTPKVIAAIRQDFKAERERRQKTEQEFAQFKASAEQREAERAAAEAEQRKKLAIALGIAPEEEPPDPAKLAEQLERQTAEHTAAIAARDAEIRQRDLRLAVLTQAPALEANGSLLMDSLSFLRTLDGLDPGAEGFAGALAEKITAACEANANYKAGKPPPKPEPTVARSGGEHNGAPGGNRQLTVADIDRMSPQEVVEAQDAGLLRDLGFAPRKKRY